MRSINRLCTRSLIISGSLILVFSLSISDFVQIASRAQSTASAQSEEAVLRTLVENFFAAYSKKDLAGVIALWSEKSPDLAAFRQNFQQQLASENLSFSNPVISRVKVENERASLRVTITLTITTAATQQKRELRLIRAFEFAREAGTWRVWRYVLAAADMAEALIKAGSESERAAIMAQEKELVTGDLVMVLLTKGGRLSSQGNYDRAKEVFELALDVANQCGDKAAIARAVMNIGNVHNSQGSYAQALEHYQKGLKILEEIGDKPGLGNILYNIGNVHNSQGNYVQALEQYQKSLRIKEEIGDKSGIANVLNGIGNIHSSRGDYVQALEQYQKGLKIKEELGDKAAMVLLVTNIGIVYQSQGNNAQALEQYHQSLKMAEEIGDKVNIPAILVDIGVVYQSQGNYAQALEQYQKSLRISQETGDKYSLALALNNIGFVHSSQGNYTQALEQYQKSLKMREEIGDQSGIATTMSNIGVVYQSQGNYAQALEQYQKSLKINEDLGEKVGIAGLSINIGTVHRLQRNYTQALEQYQKCLSISEEIGDKTAIAEAQLNMSAVYQSQGNHPKALQLAERAAELASNIGSRDLLQETLTAAGKAYFALGQLGRARQSFDAAIASIEALRTQVAGAEQEQQRFFESRVNPYQAMVELLIAQNNPNEALIYAERARARVLLDVFSGGRVSITKAMTGQEIAQERNLNGQLVSLNTQIYREKLREQADQNRLNQLEAQLRKARLDFEGFQTNLYAAHPELKVQRSEIRPVSIDDAASLIPDARTALLDFVVADDNVQLFVLTRETAGPAVLNPYTIKIERKLLAEKVQRFRGRLANMDYDYQKLAQELYGVLLKPAEKQLQNKINLIISPDNVLWDLPFQVLQPKEDHYLIEDAAISYAPSLTVLREMQSLHKKRQSRAGASILALGNPELGKRSVELARLVMMDAELQPLPEAGRQVAALGQLYGKEHSQIFTGPAAREEVVKQESSRYRILHLATHGILNNASPMYSHVMLSQALGKSDEDGLLEAWEIMNLNLNADLAVLSACETARGRIGTGEGVIGLSWALFVAGCPATVVSQWKVESSSTTALMVEFHKRYKMRFDNPQTGPSTAEAMRQASLKLMKDKQYQHPFFWGGFVVVGDGR